MLRLTKIMLGELKICWLGNFEFSGNFDLDIPHLPLYEYKCAKGKPQKKILQSVVNLKVGKPCTECRMYAVHY